MIKVNGDKFIVIRKPGLMEDEGNYHVLAICDNLQEVAEFCKEYIADGYFTMPDFVWVGSWFGKVGRVSYDLCSYLPDNLREYLRDRK